MSALPNPEQKHLRIVACAGCEALQQQVEAMAEDMHGIDRELKKKRREVSRLENQIRRLLGDDPKIEEARELFRWWIKQTGRTDRTKFDVDRQKALLRGLKLAADEFGKDKAKRAVACAIVGAARLSPVDQSTGKRHDGLELTFRNASQFEKNIERYRKWCEMRGQEPKL